MKKTFRFILPAIALMFLFNGFAAINTNAQGIPNKILTLMETHRKAMTSLKADIAMINHDPNIGDDTRTGTVMYASVRDKKDRDVDALMRLDWLKPKNEILSVIKKKFVIWDVKGGIAYTGSSDSKKVKGEAGGGLVKLLTNSSKDELKSKFTFEYLGEESVAGASVWHMRLTPKTKQDYKFADIWIDGNGMPLQAKTTALNNDTQTIQLSNLSKNVKVSADEFTVEVPKGVKKQSV
jgi:outer membrane lipoprotein-sorting protein